MSNVTVTSARNALGTVIVCRVCKLKSLRAAIEWQDSNGDVYFDGRDVTAIESFLAKHASCRGW